MALVGRGKEEFVLLDRTSDRAAEDVAVHLGTGKGVEVETPLVSIPSGLLVVFISAAVDPICPSLGGEFDLRSAVGTLRGVVHGRVDVHFLNGFRGRRR